MQKRKKVTNIQDLTDDLVNNYELLKSGKMEIHQARALMDTADKVIQGLRTQMAYNAMMENKSRIPFLEGHPVADLPPASGAQALPSAKSRKK